MTTSLFIPTIPSHIRHLYDIISHYKRGTMQTDEFIINISDYQNCDKNIIEKIERDFPDVILSKHDEKLMAGPNRQYSKELCTGDIIIYHDSDDLPHLQRIEIIKYFFEKYDILILNHSYDIKNNYNEERIKTDKTIIIESNEIYDKYFPNNILEDCLKYSNAYGSGLDFGVHAGVPSIKREVLDEIKWKNREDLRYSPLWDYLPYKGAEDYEFCMDVLYKFNKSMVIDSKIYFY